MPTPGLLTTTQAAQLLHCSRQHVVHLCDNGDLPHAWAGKHRRIHRDHIEALLGPPTRREDERSLWLNYAFAAKLVQDPDGVIERAKQRLQQLRRVHSDGSSDHYLNQWQTALDEGPDAILAIITARTEHGQAMRSASPLAGIGLLTERERTDIRAAARRHWEAAHKTAAA
jgi:excisionase family DNA binding protein